MKLIPETNHNRAMLRSSITVKAPQFMQTKERLKKKTTSLHTKKCLYCFSIHPLHYGITKHESFLKVNNPHFNIIPYVALILKNI